MLSFPPHTEFLPVGIYVDYPANTLGHVGEVTSENPILKLTWLDCFFGLGTWVIKWKEGAEMCRAYGLYGFSLCYMAPSVSIMFTLRVFEIQIHLIWFCLWPFYKGKT